MVSKSELLDFVDANRQPYPLIGVVQVGSSARGYALTGSDVDMMAFYDASGKLESHPLHSTHMGVRVTLEHHDFQTFMAGAADFRFSLASIRQLHKVRDGLALSGDDGLSSLLAMARGAHLDRSVVLYALARVARTWPAIGELFPAGQTHQLIAWTEWLGTLQAVSKPGREAYSKPKWLFRTLRGGGVGPAADLLNELDPPVPNRLARVKAAVEAIAAAFPEGRHPAPFRLLLKTVLNDAREMFEHAPTDALPAARFVAAQYYRAEFGKPPLEDLRRSGACAGDGYDVIFGDPHGGSGPGGELVARFRSFAADIGAEVGDEFQRAINSRIGTVRFFNHVLDMYESADVLPHNSLDRVAGWLGDIQGGRTTCPRFPVAL